MHHDEDAVDLKAAQERLAKMNLPATAEGQPELFRTLDNTPAPREQTPEAPFAPKTRKPRSDAGQPRPRAPKPTAPESAPALTITEVTAPDTIALTFHLPPGESFGLLQYFAQSGRADELAYIARQIVNFSHDGVTASTAERQKGSLWIILNC